MNAARPACSDRMLAAKDPTCVFPCAGLAWGAVANAPERSWRSSSNSTTGSWRRHHRSAFRLGCVLQRPTGAPQ